MPADLIPDFIPVAGLVDDAAVIAFVVARIRVDLDAFMAWEAAQNASDGAANRNRRCSRGWSMVKNAIQMVRGALCKCGCAKPMIVALFWSMIITLHLRSTKRSM